MPAINTAVAAAITAAGLATGAATADITWTTTTVEPAPGWSTTVITPAQRSPRPATRTRRHHAPRTWQAATTCRPLDDDTWTVRLGDTLWLVTTCTGTTVHAVADASGIDPGSVLRIGQVLHIPGGGAR